MINKVSKVESLENVQVQREAIYLSETIRVYCCVVEETEDKIKVIYTTDALEIPNYIRYDVCTYRELNDLLWQTGDIYKGLIMCKDCFCRYSEEIEQYQYVVCVVVPEAV
jgi:hypothetical protein